MANIYYVKENMGNYYFSENKEKVENGGYAFVITNEDIYGMDGSDCTPKIINKIDEKLKDNDIVEVEKEPVDKLR